MKRGGNSSRRLDSPKRGGDPSPILQVLERALQRNGLDKDIARYRFVTSWTEIVGKDVARRTRPECLRSGALVVRVANSAWAQELSFRKEVILKRLQRFIGSDEVVDDVHFYVGELPEIARLERGAASEQSALPEKRTKG
jgi:predicted nucleic acid-binding Zn ribbon protein